MAAAFRLRVCGCVCLAVVTSQWYLGIAASPRMVLRAPHQMMATATTQTEKEKPRRFKFIPRHDVVRSLLSLSTLVYSYGDTWSLPDKTIPQDKPYAKNIDLKKDVPEEDREKYEIKQSVDWLNKVAPRGKVASFVNVNRTDLQAAVTSSATRGAVAVVFRGSESAKDWLYDIWIRKRQLSQPGVWVHDGFYEQLWGDGAYVKLRKALRKELTRFPFRKIYVTGHSLGGALCTLCGYHLAIDMPDRDIIVVSFAAPRVGNSKFKEACKGLKNLHQLRIVNHGDIVTTIPWFAYQHVGDAIKLYDSDVKFLHEDKGWNKFWEFNMFNRPLAIPFTYHGTKVYWERFLANRRKWPSKRWGGYCMGVR